MTDDGLYERIAQILEHARGQVARSVNTAMVRRYRSCDSRMYAMRPTKS